MKRWAEKRLALMLILLLAAIWAGLPAGPTRPNRAIFSRLAWGSEHLSFRVVQEAYFHLRKSHYADPSYRSLLLGALEGMRKKVSSDEGKEKVDLIEGAEGVRWRVGGTEISVSLDEDDDEELRPLARAYELTRSAYYSESDKSRELAYAAIQGMMKRLDPHSALMDPQSFRELQVETRGEFGGIGIEISLRNGKLTVVSPIEGTPAYRIGMKAGDHIIKIEDFDTEGITLMEAVRRMRGPKGTPVTVQVRRAGVAQPLVFTIVRDIIHIRSVKSKVLPGKIGYVRLSSFVESTSRDLQKALRGLMKQEVQGLILDLRNNPGGLLRQAVEVADLFLGKGSLIVYTRGKRPELNLTFEDRRAGPFEKAPMVVLVNAGSASASEIVTGALQDLQRALIMGSRTFGKGSVQTIIPLSDGSGLRLTTALYYTPKGVEIQEKGIPPDAVVLQPGDEADRDVVPEKELLLRHEKPLKEESPSKEDSESRPNAGEPTSSKPDRPQRKPIQLGSDEDYQLSVARRVLAGASERGVAQLLIRAREILASLRQSPTPAASQP
ncbi:MAG: S41 family peptidase [Nitrospinota bacterium]